MEKMPYLKTTLWYINEHNVAYSKQPWYDHIKGHPFANNKFLSQFIYQPYDEHGKRPTFRLMPDIKFEDMRTKKNERLIVFYEAPRKLVATIECNHFELMSKWILQTTKASLIKITSS